VPAAVVVLQRRVDLGARLLQIGDRLDAMAVVIALIALELIDHPFQAATDLAEVTVAIRAVAEVHRRRVPDFLCDRLSRSRTAEGDAGEGTDEGEKTEIHDDLSIIAMTEAARLARIAMLTHHSS
jgi:hypothetical protein